MEQITLHVKPRGYGKRLIGSMIVGLFIGVSAATQAAMPSSLLTTLMYGSGDAAEEMPEEEPMFFAAGDSSSSGVLAEDDEDDEMTDDAKDDEVEQAPVKNSRPSFIAGALKNAFSVGAEEPVVTIGQDEDARKPFVYLRDLDAKEHLVADARDGGEVDLGIDSDSNLPHIKQGEDDRDDGQEEEPRAMNVFSSSTYVAPAAQPAIPQVVQGNGSSYQNVMVNNIASTIISALQNINATTIVNLNQTCGDHCTLNADVDANTDADADQDTDGSSTATTVVNQQGSGQSTVTGSGSTSGS